MNYDLEFEEDIHKEFIYNKPEYQFRKLVNGYISLEKAKQRLSKDEFYVLVIYQDGEELPKEYVPISKDLDNEQDHFATVNDELIFDVLINPGIQKITKASKPSDSFAAYFKNPNSEIFLVSDLLEEQLSAYQDEKRTI